MTRKFAKINIIPHLIFLISAIILCFPMQTKAYTSPAVSVTSIEIKEITNSNIKSELTILNREQYYVSNLNCQFKLFLGGLSNESQQIDSIIPEEIFSIDPNETIVKEFNFAYPKNINSGDYTLTAAILDVRGNTLSWNDKNIHLEGENNYLNIFFNSIKVQTGDRESYPLEGLNISPEENAIVSFKMENPGEEIAITPVIKVYQRQANMPLIKEYQDTPITFIKGETKVISLAMPKFETPESYLAEIKFYKDNEQTAGVIYARWVVKGESGKILSIKTDKDYYRSGEYINITVDSVGPADFSDIGTGTLEITVLNSMGKIIAETSKEVKLNSTVDSSLISILAENDLINPTVKARLIRDGKELDIVRIDVSTYSQEAKDVEKKAEEKEKLMRMYIVYSLTLLLIVIILIIGFILYKKFGINPFKK